MSDRPEFEFARSEEGLQAALGLLAQARLTGDSGTEGRVLLKLCYLVKWVRSDNNEPPFDRAQSLAEEALRVFRTIGDQHGIASALLQPVVMSGPDASDRRLQEAEDIARELEDRMLLANVIAARSRAMGLRDRERAKELALEALALYRDLNHSRGVAGCLFSLAIAPGESGEKRGFAVEAFYCYRQAGDTEEAGRALSLSVMNADSDEDLIELEPHFLLALSDAQSTGDHRGRERCFGFLAKIAVAKGDLGAATEYRRQETELKDLDGLPPREKWEMDVYFTKMLITAAKKNTNAEMRRMFEDQLAGLKNVKPKA